MNETTEPVSEAELRELRDKVFGRPMTDFGWEICKVRWARPEALKWLQAEAAKVKNQP